MPTFLLILQDMLIDPFMADRPPLLNQQLPVYLSRAQILTNQWIDNFPLLHWYAQLFLVLAGLCFLIGLFGLGTPPAVIALQFTTDCGLAYSYDSRDLSLSLTSSQKCRNLVSLFLGKLCVDLHQCSFDQDSAADESTSAYFYPAIIYALMS